MSKETSETDITDQEQFDAQAFLVENGIESLSERPVRGHDGEMLPLAEALSSCEPARTAIESAVEMAREMGDGDVLAPMTTYLERLEKKAQDPSAQHAARASASKVSLETAKQVEAEKPKAVKKKTLSA